MRKNFCFILTSLVLTLFISCKAKNPDYINLLFRDWANVEVSLESSESNNTQDFFTEFPEYQKFIYDFNDMCQSEYYDNYVSVYFDSDHNYFKEYVDSVNLGISLNDLNIIRSAVLKFELISKNQSSKASKYYLNLIIILSAVLFLIFLFLFIIIKRYEKEIENSEQLGVYATFVMGSVEKERHRISKEIHDSVLQDLRFIQFKADELKDGISNEELKNTKNTIIDFTGKSISNLRNICQNLTPSELKNVKDENTLITAIRNLCQKFQEQYDIQCVLSIQNNLEMEELTLQKSMNLFHIIKEALNNVQQHAQASYVSVVLKNNTEKENEKNHLVIYITDDGKGFDVNAVPKHKHFGLINMKERAKLIGAQISIQSDADTGTEIMIEI